MKQLDLPIMDNTPLEKTSGGRPNSFAYLLDDGDPVPLPILAKIEGRDARGKLWGWGYSELVPRGEYGSLDPGCLVFPVEPAEFRVLQQAILEGDPLPDAFIKRLPVFEVSAEPTL